MHSASVRLISLAHALLTAGMNGGVPIEDSLFALRQIVAHPNILPLMLGNATSIAFFNFFVRAHPQLPLRKPCIPHCR